MPNTKRFLHKRKVPAIPEKDVSVYFKVKYMLGKVE